MDSANWVTIAQIAGARGNRGEIAAIYLTSHPERFQNLQRVFLLLPNGVRHEGILESVWEHKGRLIVKFRGVDSIDSAEALAGAEMQLPRDERWPIEEGEFYHSDLIGCEVVARESGKILGRVSGIQEYGGPALLEISEGSRPEKLLVPFVGPICVGIHPEQRRIEVVLPEGMEDLNRKGPA